MITDDVITLTDPVWEPPAKPTWLGRTFGKYIKDERDLPFIKLSILMTLILPPLAIALYVPGFFRWWMAPIYWVPYLILLGPFILMLHNTSHRTLFKKEYDGWNKYIPWVNGIFVGQSPETYFVHHMAMHHIEGNLPDDLSSTMKYRRDSFLHFLHYFFTFILFGPAQVIAYLRKRNRPRMVRRFLIGELSHLGLMAVLFFVNWQATIVVFAFPLVMTRFMLMAGNWGQHAFVDPEDPTNDYRTVISFINSPYNHKCFNDGYHLGHHLKASRHWLEMPQDFLDKREEMVKHDSLVFDRLDYFMIFALLMLKRHRFLTKFVVQLDPDNPKSQEELLALFDRRLQPFSEEALAPLRRQAA